MFDEHGISCVKRKSLRRDITAYKVAKVADKNLSKCHRTSNRQGTRTIIIINGSVKRYYYERVLM